MAFTTDVYDEMDRRNLKLAATDLARETPGGGGGLSDIPAAAPTGRNFGFRSGAAQPGGVAERNLAATAGKELGEPTSFNAGAGAPEPIAIMRGTRTTFSPGQPEGRQFALPEVATDLQARQAWNRTQLAREQGEVAGLPISPESKVTLAEAAKERFGEWQPAGGALAEITAEGRQPGAKELRVAQTAELNRKEAAAIGQQNVDDFTKQWQGTHGQYDKSGVYQKPTDPNVVRDKAMATEIARTQGTEAGLKHYQESTQFRSFEPLFTPENLTTFRAGLPPAAQNNPVYSDAYLNAIKQHPQAWRETVLQLGPKLRQLTPLRPPRSVGTTLWEGEPGGQFVQ